MESYHVDSHSNTEVTINRVISHALRHPVNDYLIQQLQIITSSDNINNNPVTKNDVVG